MPTLLGPHCTEKQYDTAARGRLLDYSLRLNPYAINILRSQDPAGALYAALEHKTAIPDMVVMVRHMFGSMASGDENMLKTYPNPNDYYRDVLSKYIGTGLVPVCGNEITLDGPDDYKNILVPYYVSLMQQASKDGLQLGIARFPSWHPYRAQFSQFTALKQAFAIYPGHYLTPNWYFTLDNYDAIFKGIEFWQYLGKPKIVVGEFGLLGAPGDANSGFKSMGISQSNYAYILISVIKDLLARYNIPVLYFTRGIWFRSNTFETTSEFESVLVQKKGELQMTAPTPPPPSQDILFYVDVTANPSLRMRTGPSTTSTTRTTIPQGTRIGVLEGAPGDIGQDRWVKVHHAGLEGYVYALYLQAVASGDTIPLETHQAIVQEFQDRLDVAKELAHRASINLEGIASV